MSGENPKIFNKIYYLPVNRNKKAIGQLLVSIDIRYFINIKKTKHLFKK